jgi:hypothetical protein
MMTKRQAAREEALSRMKAAAMAYHAARVGGGNSGRAVTAALESMDEYALSVIAVQRTEDRRKARQAKR